MNRLIHISLLTLIVIPIFGIDLTKPLVMDISRTYGYVTSQTLVAEKLKKKYPEVKQDLFKAQLEFDLKFKSSMKNIEKSFGEEWQKYQEIMDSKLTEQVNTLNLDSSYKAGFANEILQRAKGNIESPVIETLLMFNPTYQKYPTKEFGDGFKKRLYSKDTTKSKGIDFHIDVPQSWKVKDAKRPNTLWLVNYNNGYLDEDDSPVSFGVVIKELPEKIESLTSQDAKDFCKEAFNDNSVKECIKTTLENLPAIYARNTMTLERLRSKNTMEVANYIVFYEDRAIFLQGMVGTFNDKLSQKELNKKFDKYLPLFDQIANSLVIKDLYTKKENKQTQYYLFKLFDNKFQTVFPDTPSIQEIPKELLYPKTIIQSIPYEYRKDLTQKQIDTLVEDTIKKIKNSTPYYYSDTINQISYTAQTMQSGLKYDIGEYKSSIKNDIDEMLKNALKVDNRTLIDFTSTLDRKNDLYIAIYNSSYYLEGQKVYSSTKHIYFKDKIYKWSVSYVDKKNKEIFDNYENNVKVFK